MEIGKHLRALALVLLLIPAAGVKDAAAADALPRGELAVIAQSGLRHKFEIEIARTPMQRSQGLMFRQSLAPMSGMLFDFEATVPVSMWMKNTLIPLDMLFIAENGQVVNIAERTVPHSLAEIPAARPVRYVLEVAGGTASRLGLAAGDRVELPKLPSR